MRVAMRPETRPLQQPPNLQNDYSLGGLTSVVTSDSEFSGQTQRSSKSYYFDAEGLFRRCLRWALGSGLWAALLSSCYKETETEVTFRYVNSFIHNNGSAGF